MTSFKSLHWLAVVTALLVGVALSQSDDNESKTKAPSISQQQRAEQQQTPQQQSSSSSAKSMPDAISYPFVNPFPSQADGDESDAILIPYNSALGEDFDDEAAAGDAEEENSLLEDSNEIEKRYRPRFVGKRYRPRFVGKRYKPRFVGKRYTPRFVGKRYTPRFVGKRYTPRFVGKRYTPRFVGKRAAEQTNEQMVAHSIQKRQAPRFIGKRESVYEPLGVAAWELGENDNVFDNGDEYYEEEEEVNEGNGCSDNQVDKRKPPRFIGKRGPPRFVGKRGPPRFVGKRGAPRFIGKRGAPRFIGKRAGAPRFIGKRGPPRFVGKRGPPRFVGKRGPPRFVGKRSPPRFVGKRSEDELEDYLLQLAILNDTYDTKRAVPRFVGKKSVYSDFGKRRLQDDDVQSFLDNWSRQEAIKKLVDNDKRWGSPVTPSFIGKRMDSDDFER